MDPDIQIDRWVNGESIHDTEGNQCVPDFSCCFPILKAEKIERLYYQRFYLAGNQFLVDDMTLNFTFRFFDYQHRAKERLER